MYFSNSGQNSGQSSKKARGIERRCSYEIALSNKKPCKRRMSQTNHFSSVSLQKGKAEKPAKPTALRVYGCGGQI